jgi:hypothetical protein
LRKNKAPPIKPIKRAARNVMMYAIN